MIRCIFKNYSATCEAQDPYAGCRPVPGPPRSESLNVLVILAEIEAEQAERRALSASLGACQ